MPLPGSSLLLIEERPDGFFLVRYSANGEIAGNTWHKNLDEAKGQATFELGEWPTVWSEIPSEEPDPFAYMQVIRDA